MIRNLKALLLTTMVAAALGAVTASAVQAHTPATFHCAVEPCVVTMTPDGAVPSKTSHIVIDVVFPPNIPVAITCNQYTEEGTLAKKTVTSYIIKNIKYHGCVFLGQAATINTNECTYNLTEEEATVECPAGKEIVVETVGCQVAVPPQGPLKGVKYHNIKPGSVKEVTVETLLKGIKTTATGAGCPGTGTSTNSEITTGNGILTGEEDQIVSNMVDFSWSATVP